MQQSPHGQFSYHTFSTFSKLISLWQQQSGMTNKTQSNKITVSDMVRQIQEQFLTYSQPKYEMLVFSLLKNKLVVPVESKPIVSTQLPTPYQQSLKTFLQHYSQTRTRINNIQLLCQNPQKTKITVVQGKRMYTVKQLVNRIQGKGKGKGVGQKEKGEKEEELAYRCFVVYGKAINVERRSKDKEVSAQQPQAKTSIIQQLQHCMTQLYEQQKLPYLKSQPHQLQDLLLTHQTQLGQEVLPIIVSNEVYRHFVPVEGCILLLVQQEPVKVQVPFIIKNTLLHVYLDNHRALAKTVNKETFFKNANFRGVYFVEQGEVQTKSGRVVARGWVIAGKCRSTTQAWRFTKLMTFFKFIVQNDNVWKQFVNDLKLNGQWPIKINDVLNLDQKQFQQLMGQQSQSFSTNLNPKKRFKFPPISNRLNHSFDINKLSQIQRMKHFNQKLNHLQEYKQEMMKRKVEQNRKRYSMHNSQEKSESEEKETAKRIQILSQRMNLPGKGLKTDVSRSTILRSGDSAANLLVSGIVKKLKSMHENAAESQRGYNKSNYSKEKELNRSRTKILGLKRYQQILRTQKNHLYKGRNFYN